MLSSRIVVLSAVLLGFCQGKDADTVRLFMKLKGGASELANTRASKQQSTQLKRELTKILLGIRDTGTPLWSSLMPCNSSDKWKSSSTLLSHVKDLQRDS